MTLLSIMSASVAVAAPTHLDPVKLFLDADIVVQVVMVGLLLASVWVWMIVVSFSLKLGKLRKRGDAFERDFWDADEPEKLLNSQAKSELPSARIASVALAELKRSIKDGIRDKNGVRERTALAMDGQVASEVEDLSKRLNFLATTGSVAPFVGLFGTVWGIMNSFFQIGLQQNSSLAVVAPGISEALFATAIGLFAAIPAVVAYNRFSNKVNGYEAHLHRFSDRVQAQVSRELERA